MASTMQAAVVETFGQPLVLREWDMPTPGPGQIVVKTEACGVCHTDLHAANGDWPVKPTPPFIPGHEAIGPVVAVGAGVTIVKEGDRIGVPWLYSACGRCEYCLKAQETVCAKAQFGGYTKNGGFAEYILADPNYVAHIPDGLSSIEAAPLVCAGITTYKGIKETGARPGEWIAVSGAGEVREVPGSPDGGDRHRRHKARTCKTPRRRSCDQRQRGRPGGGLEKGDGRRCSRGPDYSALPPGVQAGSRHDA